MSIAPPELVVEQPPPPSSRLVSIFRRLSGPDATTQEAAVWLAGTLGITAVAAAVAFAAVGAGLFLACGAAWPIALEWFAPVYLLKLVGAHAVPPARD